MKKKIIIFSLALMLILSTLIILLNDLSTNDELLVVKESLITYQSELESKFQSEGYGVDNPNIIVDPYENSPLTALVIFETKKEVAPSITILGKDELSTYNHIFDANTIHYIPIYGLYAGVENTVIIKIEDEEYEIKIKTEELPENFVLPTNVYKDKTKLTNDLYFFTPATEGYTCAYDTNGDVRWYLTNYGIWKIGRIENGNLVVSTERLVNAPYYMTGLYEIDMLGKIYEEYSLEGGYHHDYNELENGNLLIASNDFNNDYGTVEDYIVEMDKKTGKIVKTIDLKEILNMEDGKSENWIDYDWFHNNSVWYDEVTNSITLSGRHQDAVINIDYDTNKLNWIIGDSTNWSEEYQQYFLTPIGDNFEWQWSQHAASITPEGYVFIFDNGNNKSKIKDNYIDASNSYSRGVMYKIDKEKMTIEQIYQYGKERGADFYSPYISDVDYINKDHYIIHSGGTVYLDEKVLNSPAGLGDYDKLVSNTVEVKDNQVIFEVSLPTNNYRVEKMPLYSDNSFSLKKAIRKGSLGKTDIDSINYGFMLNAKKINEDYNSHNIELFSEEDRLVIKGTFFKGNEVNVVLYKNGVINKYNFPITKTPYTALCVDIFTQEETKNGIIVSKYINFEGLSGSYSVYIEIDGVIYNSSNKIEIGVKNE